MKPEHLKIFQALPEVELMTITILLEGRADPVEGWIAIGNVIKNRVFHRTWDGDIYHKVMLMPKQFSCYNDHVPGSRDEKNFQWGLELLQEVPEQRGALWHQAVWVSFGIIENRLLDNTKEALNYHSVYIPNPFWAEKMVKTVRIGSHIFYKDK